MFKNRVPGRTLGPKRKKVERGWGKSYSNEVHGLYSTSHFIRTSNLGRISWEGGVVNMGKTRNASRAFWWGNSNERDHFTDVCVDGRIIVK